ncbi:MAG: hypothetical protein QNJ72_31695 [Pleurocapsa sp. MO_226.B13]|nr:hypothetical protein [Pleurocapsa sp. MO_226.B13]
MDKIVKVGISELRSKLATYLNSKQPIAIVRRDRTIGYFVPASVSEDSVELDTLEQATSELTRLLKQRQ